MDTLAKQHRGMFRTCTVMKVRDHVEAGAGLAAAMSEQPEVFDPASVRLVEVGENAGTLDEVLAEVEFKLQLAAFKDKISTAMMYPVFLACFGLAAAVFLMTWVLPPLLESLQETLPQLPWPTRVAKGLSDLLVQYGIWLAIGVGAATVAARLWLGTAAGQRTWHRFVLRLPVIGTLVNRLSRVAMIVASLTRGGVLLTTAVQLAAKSTSNSVMHNALFNAEKDMSTGEDLATSLERRGVFHLWRSDSFR